VLSLLCVALFWLYGLASRGNTQIWGSLCVFAGILHIWYKIVPKKRIYPFVRAVVEDQGSLERVFARGAAAPAMARAGGAPHLRLGVLLLLATVAPCARGESNSSLGAHGGDSGTHPDVLTQACVVQGACSDAAETRRSWTVSASQPIVLEVHGLRAQLLTLAVAPDDGTLATSIEIRRNQAKAKLTKYELPLVAGKLEHITLVLDYQGFLSVNVHNSTAENSTAGDRSLLQGDIGSYFKETLAAFTPGMPLVSVAVPILQMKVKTGENISYMTLNGSESGCTAIRVKTHGWRLGDLHGMITETSNQTNHSFARASCTQVSQYYY
jgi:hypothetical protein